jgi:endonuclease/exonuclease/phosphatase family metal-dependent hydrolase
MKIASYNIHYATGKDERYDLERVIETPLDTLRIYNLHFGSVAADERLLDRRGRRRLGPPALVGRIRRRLTYSQ